MENGEKLVNIVRA